MNRSRGRMAGIAAIVVIVLLGAVIIWNRNNAQPERTAESTAVVLDNSGDDATAEEGTVEVETAEAETVEAETVAEETVEADAAPVVTEEPATEEPADTEPETPADAEATDENAEAVETEEPAETAQAVETESAVDTPQAEETEVPASRVTTEATTVASAGPFEEMSIFGGTVDPSITDAETLFIDNCAKCHGLEGLGNGQSLGSLGTITGNFVLVAMPDYSDEELFDIISNGKGIEMPPWGLVMTEEQRWALVDYVRTLRPDGS